MPLSPVDRCRVFQSSPTAPLKTPKSPRPTHCVPHVVTPLNGLIGRRPSIYIFFLSSPSSSSSHSSFYLLKASQFFFFFSNEKNERKCSVFVNLHTTGGTNGTARTEQLELKKMSTNDDTAHHLSLAIAFTFRSRRKFGSCDPQRQRCGR